MSTNFGIVILDKLMDNILLVKDHPDYSEHHEQWNFINGPLSVNAEKHEGAVISTVKNKTGLEIVSNGIVRNPHFEPYKHIASATALDGEIKVDSKQLKEAKWFDVHEFLHLPAGEIFHPDMKVLAQFLMHGGKLNYLFK